MSRILRGPGISPSSRSTAANQTPPRGSSAASLLSSPCTPRAHEGIVTLPGLETFISSNNQIQTPQASPNPFIVTPPFGTPTTPRAAAALSYQTTFNDSDDPLTSPALCSPTNRGPRALRRHGAVALLVPQTPSVTNWLVNVAAATTPSSPGNLGADLPEDNGTPQPLSKARATKDEQGVLDIISDGMFIWKLR